MAATHRIDSGSGRIIAIAEHERRLAESKRLRNSSAWQRVRAAVIRRQPWCSRCGATTSLEADHIVRLIDGGAPLDPANLRVLCRACNGRH